MWEKTEITGSQQIYKLSRMQKKKKKGFPGGSAYPGKGNGNPIQYSCLENPWTEKPGGLLFCPTHKKVGQDLATKQQHNAE